MVHLIELLLSLLGDENSKAGEILFWTIAGHDTTGYTMSNILIRLAQNPGTQARLREEVLAKSETSSTEYLHYVMKETERVTPVAAMGSIRTAGRAFQVDSKHIIPKGSVCVFAQCVQNCNESIYDRPNEFLPDRWLDNSNYHLQESHMPSSTGTRNCPERSMAPAEIYVVIPALLRNFPFEFAETGRKECSSTLKLLGCQLKASTSTILWQMQIQI